MPIFQFRVLSKFQYFSWDIQQKIVNEKTLYKKMPRNSTHLHMWQTYKFARVSIDFLHWSTSKKSAIRSCCGSDSGPQRRRLTGYYFCWNSFHREDILLSIANKYRKWNWTNERWSEYNRFNPLIITNLMRPKDRCCWCSVMTWRFVRKVSHMWRSYALSKCLFFEI